MAERENSVLQHRPVERRDWELICTFPQNAEELYYFSPKAAHPLTPQQLQHAIEQRTDSTVVEREGEVVAFTNFYRWESGVCCIGNLIVAPAARGRGVAHYLVNIMLALARSRHSASEVRISCFNHNTAGLLLYSRLGFTPFALEERRAPDGARVALIHMSIRGLERAP
jgi:ribosomal protein S18 acetylase RimI-like enzyme